jgi:hypothetical protein
MVLHKMAFLLKWSEYEFEKQEAKSLVGILVNH